MSSQFESQISFARIDDGMKGRLRTVWLTERGRALVAVIDRARADQFLAVVRPLPANERAIVAMGVAALATPGDFEDWSRHPRRLLLHSRSIGIIRRSDFPRSLEDWALPLKTLRASAVAPELAPRALLVMHGSDDAVVPLQDARTLAQNHGTADLRIIRGAGHNLRQDPRAMAVLLGWLDRQRRRVPF